MCFHEEGEVKKFHMPFFTAASTFIEHAIIFWTLYVQSHGLKEVLSYQMDLQLLYASILNFGLKVENRTFYHRPIRVDKLYNHMYILVYNSGKSCLLPLL